MEIASGSGPRREERRRTCLEGWPGGGQTSLAWLQRDEVRVTAGKVQMHMHMQVQAQAQVQTGASCTQLPAGWVGEQTQTQAQTETEIEISRSDPPGLPAGKTASVNQSHNCTDVHAVEDNDFASR